MQWKDERAMDLFRRKTEEVRYLLGKTDQYEDQSKDILNSILKEELSDIYSDSGVDRGTMSRRGFIEIKVL